MTHQELADAEATAKRLSLVLYGSDQQEDGDASAAAAEEESPNQAPLVAVSAPGALPLIPPPVGAAAGRGKAVQGGLTAGGSSAKLNGDACGIEQGVKTRAQLQNAAHDRNTCIDAGNQHSGPGAALVSAASLPAAAAAGAAAIPPVLVPGCPADGQGSGQGEIHTSSSRLVAVHCCAFHPSSNQAHMCLFYVIMACR